MVAQTKEVVAASKPLGDYTIEVVEPSGGVLKIFLRKLDRATLEVCLSKMGLNGGTPRMIEAGELILRSCMVKGGDEAKVLGNEDYTVAASLQAFELIDIVEARLKKN